MCFFSAQVSVAGQDDDSIYGTYSVVFEPVQIGGELQGCTLAYKAVRADNAYLGGKPVVIVGNIGIGQFGTDLVLMMKVGVKELVGDHSFVRPNFAYLQTESHSTAKANQQTKDGAEGFSLFFYSLYDPPVTSLFTEMMDSKKVTIAFNRIKNGIDVLVPVDLDVVDVEYPGGNSIVRKRSKETLANFSVCFFTLSNQVKQSFEMQRDKSKTRGHVDKGSDKGSGL